MKRVRVYEITKCGPEEGCYDHYEEVFTSRPLLTFRAARRILDEKVHGIPEPYEIAYYIRNRCCIQLSETQLLIMIHHNLTETLNSLEKPHYE